MTPKNLEEQYNLNKKFYDSKNNLFIIAELLEKGVPYAHSELYQYGIATKNNFELHYYSGAMLRDFSVECLFEKNYKTLFVLIESQKWTIELSTKILQEAIFFNQHSFELIYDKITATYPISLTDFHYEQLYFQTFSFKSKMNAIELRKIICIPSDSATLILWNCDSIDYKEKIDILIYYYQYDFPDTYIDKINFELDFYFKKNAVTDLKKLDYLQNIYSTLENQSNDWRIFAIKSLVKKYNKEHKNPNFYLILYQHLELLDNSQSDTISKTKISNPDLESYIHKTILYIKLSKSLPIKKDRPQKNKI